MFPIPSTAARHQETCALEHRTFRIELPDVDVTRVESLAVEAVPRIGPGDKVCLRSGVTAVYRRVARVEPIKGGGALIWLESGYIILRERGQIPI
jgi:hypothetical protein